MSADANQGEQAEIPDDTADDAGGEGAGGESRGAVSEGNGESKQTRKERRQSEFQAAQESARAAREELAGERRERERLAAQVAELNGRFQENTRQQQQNAKDPYAEKIAQLEDDAQGILEQVAATKDPARQKELMKQWNAKQREAAKLDLRRDIEKEQRENPQQNQQQGLSPRDQAIWVALEADYPVMADAGKSGQQFRAVTDLHLNRLIAEGKPDNLSTMRAACALAAKDLKIGGQDSKASNGSRGAFGGYSAGDGEGGRGDSPRTVAFGPTEQALAMAMANRTGKGQTPEQARSEWLKRVGPGVAKRLTSDE